MLQHRRVLLLVSLLLLVAFAGCGPQTVAGKSGGIRLEIRAARSAAFPGASAARFARTGETLYLSPEILVSNSDLAEVAVGAMAPPGQGYGILLRLTPKAGDRLGSFTFLESGERFAVLLDHQIVMAPKVEGVLSHSVVLDAGFTEQEARYLAEALTRYRAAGARS
jgi:preprotein translocase subunit SecD